VMRDFKRLTEAKLAALRYRSRDAVRALTPAAVRAARAADLKAEILNSSRLQARLRLTCATPLVAWLLNVQPR
jgi:hypothetical protein